jgi:hypothetical protein
VVSSAIVLGHFLPKRDKRPEYTQLYIFDTQNELMNSLHVSTYKNRTFQPNEEIVAALMQILDAHNLILKLLVLPVIDFLG